MQTQYHVGGDAAVVLLPRGPGVPGSMRKSPRSNGLQKVERGYARPSMGKGREMWGVRKAPEPG